MRARLITMFFIGILLATGAARAQDVMDGQRIARTWCSGCHKVDAQEQKVGNDAVPSFSSIAQMNSTTAISLAAFLSTAHGRMPDYSLSRIEIQNVSAYILSLRKSR
jgi:mono/diheme cytochrome c family protein